MSVHKREFAKEKSFTETASADIYTILRDFSKDNRRQQTPYEYALWQELRKLKCGVRFRRQHPIGDYIADFVCLPKRLIIEIDGGYHNNAEQAEFDRMRTSWLEKKGYQVIRFTNEEIAYKLKEVVQTIKQQVL